jgi:hypothetical protein
MPKSVKERRKKRINSSCFLYYLSSSFPVLHYYFLIFSPLNYFLSFLCLFMFSSTLFPPFFLFFRVSCTSFCSMRVFWDIYKMRTRFIKIGRILNRHEPTPNSLEAVLLQALSKNWLLNPMKGFGLQALSKNWLLNPMKGFGDEIYEYLQRERERERENSPLWVSVTRSVQWQNKNEWRK